MNGSKIKDYRSVHIICMVFYSLPPPPVAVNKSRDCNSGEKVNIKFSRRHYTKPVGFSETDRKGGGRREERTNKISS